MPPEQFPECRVSRRALVFGGITTAILATSLAEGAGAQTTSPNQAPSSLPPADARQAAEIGKLQAETEEIQSRTRQSETLASKAKEYLSPVSAALGGLSGVGVLLSFNQWLQQRRAQAEAARYSQLTKIGDLLHSTEPNERTNGAEQLLTTMARSTRWLTSYKYMRWRRARWSAASCQLKAQ